MTVFYSFSTGPGDSLTNTSGAGSSGGNNTLSFQQTNGGQNSIETQILFDTETSCLRQTLPRGTGTLATRAETELNFPPMDRNGPIGPTNGGSLDNHVYFGMQVFLPTDFTYLGRFSSNDNGASGNFAQSCRFGAGVEVSPTCTEPAGDPAGPNAPTCSIGMAWTDQGDPDGDSLKINARMKRNQVVTNGNCITGHEAFIDGDIWSEAGNAAWSVPPRPANGDVRTFAGQWVSFGFAWLWDPELGWHKVFWNGEEIFDTRQVLAWGDGMGFWTNNGGTTRFGFYAPGATNQTYDPLTMQTIQETWYLTSHYRAATGPTASWNEVFPELGMGDPTAAFVNVYATE